METKTVVVLLAALVGQRVGRAENGHGQLDHIVSGQRDPRDGTCNGGAFLELFPCGPRTSTTPSSTTPDRGFGWGKAVAGDPRRWKERLGRRGRGLPAGLDLEPARDLARGPAVCVSGNRGQRAYLDVLAPHAAGGGGIGCQEFVGVPVTHASATAGRVHQRGPSVLESSYEIRSGRFGLGNPGGGTACVPSGCRVDARYRNLGFAALSGLVRWSLAETAWLRPMRAANWQARRYLDVTADYRRTAPDLFFAYSISRFLLRSAREFGGYFSCGRGFAAWTCRRFTKVTMPVGGLETREARPPCGLGSAGERGSASKAGAKIRGWLSHGPRLCLANHHHEDSRGGDFDVMASTTASERPRSFVLLHRQSGV